MVILNGKEMKAIRMKVARQIHTQCKKAAILPDSLFYAAVVEVSDIPDDGMFHSG